MTRCPLPRPSRPSRQQPASSGHGCAPGASSWGCPRRLWPTSPNCTGRSSARSSAASATSASTTSCVSPALWTSTPAIWCEGCDDQLVTQFILSLFNFALTPISAYANFLLNPQSSIKSFSFSVELPACSIIINPSERTPTCPDILSSHEAMSPKSNRKH